jgi:hypothetical protein
VFKNKCSENKNYAKHTGNVSNNKQITLHGINIAEIDLFTYLGSLITSEGGAVIDVKNRINKARSAFGIHLKVWLSIQEKHGT